jgi:hypothetical protein
MYYVQCTVVRKKYAKQKEAVFNRAVFVKVNRALHRYLQYLSNEGSVGEAEELPAHLLGVRHASRLPGHY